MISHSEKTATSGTSVSAPESGNCHRVYPRSVSSAGWPRILVVAMPLLALLALTVFFRSTDADMAISRLFYLGSYNHWAGLRLPLFVAVYDFGFVPAIVMGIGGLVLALASYTYPHLQSYRRIGFFVFALLALGPGLIVNGICKPNFQRPRPKHMVEFGGDIEFVPVLSASTADHGGKSFPSGHASMGFVLMAPGFLLLRRNLIKATAWFLAGCSFGFFVGFVRVTQGAHFTSDVLWAGGLVYLSGLGLTLLFDRFYAEQQQWSRAGAPLADASMTPAETAIAGRQAAA